MSHDKLQIREAQKIQIIQKKKKYKKQKKTQTKRKSFILSRAREHQAYNPTTLDYTVKPCTEIILTKSYQSTLTSYVQITES